MERLRERLCELYRGTSPRAAAFQYGLLAFDLAIIAFFVAVSFLDPGELVIVAVDLVLAVVLALVMRALRILRSYHVLGIARRRSHG